MEAITDALRSQLENQFFTGGAVIAIVTAVVVWLRGVPGYIVDFAQRRIITTIDVSDQDAAFHWIQDWLSEHAYTKAKARSLTLTTRRVKYDDNSEPEIVLSPAPGVHLLRFGSGFVLVTRERREAQVMGDTAYRESFTVRCLSRASALKLVEEARAKSIEKQRGKCGIYLSRHDHWVRDTSATPRPSESVVLASGVFENLRADLKAFIGEREWYERVGIPYRRGYLLTGAPGNGKTSTVSAMAGVFKRDIYCLSIAGVNAYSLGVLLGELPNDSILLIEDIDCLYGARSKDKDNDNPARSEVSMSSFLNAIDGVGSKPGRLMFVTTNHAHKLDPALVRPGRLDRHIEFANADRDMAARMFLRFFPDHGALAERFGGRAAGWSMARVQEHLVRNRNDPHAASADAEDMAQREVGDV